MGFPAQVGFAMHIDTTRFGPVHVDADDILLFPNGIVGFEDCRHWILLADQHNDSVAWLQSIVRPEVALAVVSPRRFVPGYQLRVSRRELAPLELAEPDQAYVLGVVGKHGGRLTLNLRAPLIINFDRRLGRQVIASDEEPMQLELAGLPIPSRKSA
jgi:flagellar assembly factor FliW